VENPFCQRQCRKNRKSDEHISSPPTSWGHCKYYILSSMAEECFTSSSSATYHPSMATVCYLMVYSTFINKNKLVSYILANAKCIVSLHFSTTL
jgi:hypothetical protein